jgi:hypothetical protein
VDEAEIGEYFFLTYVSYLRCGQPRVACKYEDVVEELWASRLEEGTCGVGGIGSQTVTEM